MRDIKHNLRSLLEAVFRRVPVARAAYAERDALRERVLLSQERDVARFLKLADTAARNRLFDAFGEIGLSEFLYAEFDELRFLVNAKDQSIGRSIFISGSSDFNKFEVAANLLKRHNSDPIELLVDVGANIGSICIPALARGFAERAIAIEPHPTNCRLLRANIALNGLSDHIEVMERAASASDASPLTLELSRDNWGDHRIALSQAPGRYGEAERARIEVPSVTLDSLKGIDPKTRYLLWMDVQGYEGHALRGAKRLLSDTPPLVLEFWPYGMLRADSFSALCQSIAHYKGFYDLQRPERSQRPRASWRSFSRKSDRREASPTFWSHDVATTLRSDQAAPDRTHHLTARSASTDAMSVSPGRPVVVAITLKRPGCAARTSWTARAGPTLYPESED